MYLIPQICQLLAGNLLDRDSIEMRVTRERGIVAVFIESVCDDPAVIAANVALKVSSGDPDYATTSPGKAKIDFLRRIREYEAVYQTISESHLSYLKIINVGSQVILNRINGYLQSRIAFYLMNLHLKPRSIFFSRHGESQFNVEGKIGGDSSLSTRGMKYARALPDLITDNIGNAPLTVSVPTNVHSFYCANRFVRQGLDFNTSANDPNRAIPSIQQVDVEIAGRT